jgi:hypothetical protein
MEKIKDRIWLWGQDPGTHHLQLQGSSGYKLPGTKRFFPMLVEIGI